jgi:very-short-patch-repair endonuclease
LIEHVRNPGAQREKLILAAKKSESPFELEIARRLLSDGYDVEQQVLVGRYRLDMVVRGGGQQVAVECDGDRFHGFDQIPADLARQAILERVGWRFARIRGTRFYRHPDQAMAELRARLGALGVTPDGAGLVTSPGPDVAGPLIGQLLRDAWQIARDQLWVESPEPLSDEIGEVQQHGLTN